MRTVRAGPARWAAAVGLVAAAALGAGCDDESTPADTVDESAAYTAIVEWQAGEQDLIENDDGTLELPIIYVVAADGDTIAVGVQANVAKATVDVADVRFADDSAEAFDTGVDGEPVIDHGVLLVVGAMPDPAPVVDVDVLRYLAADSSTPFVLQIATDVVPTSTGVGTATVTSVTSS